MNEKSPALKMLQLLKFIEKQSKYDGEKLEYKIFQPTEVLNNLGFNNFLEANYYIISLADKGYLKMTLKNKAIGNIADNIQLTLDGLQYLIDSEDQIGSKTCFVAMSFTKNEGTNQLRDTIKKAVTDCGYEPILIDEVHYSSEVTINDAMIANIKKCKFLIADFTENKHGVYFEAGYALGRKKPVIYTCHSNDFKNSHFDTNHYPHIVYSNMEELNEKLANKIMAVIEYVDLVF